MEKDKQVTSRRRTRKKVQTQRSSFNAHTKLRHSKIAQQRMKIRIWKGVFIVLGIFLLINAISWFSFSNLIAVRALVVSGNHQISTLAVEAHIFKMTDTPYMVFFSRDTIFTFPNRQVKDSLIRTFPDIKTVQVSTRLLQRTVDIRIVERAPYALWCKSVSVVPMQCYFADTDGYIYEKAKNVSTTSTPYIIFENKVLDAKKNPLRSYISYSYFAKIKKFVQILSVRGYRARKIMINGTDGIVTMASGWQVKIPLDKDLSITAHNLLDVIEKSSVGTELSSIKYIDMRFNRRVYYKFR